MAIYIISPDLSDDAIQQVLGERLSRQRIGAALTQAQLAQRAGVSTRTVVRMEAGQGGDLRNFIRVARTLGLVEGFNALVPALPPSPIEQLKLGGRQRQRVRAPRKSRGPAAQTAGPWRKP
ncbi:MAG: helix-turn-helix transcriptional regulator [Gammaproteobacteria bacterium]|nr:helix-turn-helix transcriptional regulator [Gammaproteobacteria bacterium]